MKKLMAFLMCLVMLFALTSCGGTDTSTSSVANGENKPLTIDQVEKTVATATKKVAKDDFKIGLICLHDDASTYDNNFILALKEAQKELGLKDSQVLIKVNKGENEECYNAAAELVEAGCNIIFADSFGHETYLMQAAAEFPDVQFCHATGTKSLISKLPNFHNAFASIYEGRFLAGVAAGMKLNQMIEDKKITADKAVIGYVGAFDYAEVVSGMTSFFLGARYICPTATMKVTYTNSWFDIAKEKEAANSLMDAGCVLISQHADSEGAPKACEARNVPNVAYNISTTFMGPNTAIISSKIDWAPYFKLIINSALNGTVIPTDYCGTMKDGYVALTELNEKVAAPGTAEKITELKAKLEDGSLKVFDTSTFTVDGKKLETYLADIVDMGDFVPDSEAVKNGVFTESSDRSAPYFAIKYIDGISEK